MGKPRRLFLRRFVLVLFLVISNDVHEIAMTKFAFKDFKNLFSVY